MANKEKYKKSIELFHEKTGELVRTIRFKTPKEFDKFLHSYRLMRYPGYNWRYIKNTSRKRN
jgi:hypothetical protein